jgi:RNA polymerase sigma-70 factor (ECF subfamily)
MDAMSSCTTSDAQDDASVVPAATHDETLLVSRLRAGDNAAFEELLAIAGPRMMAIARRMMPTESDAEDAVQDALLSAFRALDRFDGRSRLTTWLHQIVVNACLMKLRTRRRRPETSIEGLLPQFVPDGHQKDPAKPWHRDAHGGIESAELRALVRSKIDELPEQYRVVLVLRDAAGLDTAQTAEVLGITQDAVKTRVHRARQALKALLDPYFERTS